MCFPKRYYNYYIYLTIYVEITFTLPFLPTFLWNPLHVLYIMKMAFLTGFCISGAYSLVNVALVELTVANIVS